VDFDEDTGDGRRNRTIAFSVLGLVTLGVILGLLVGGLGLAAMRTTNLGGGDPAPADPTSDAPSTQETPEPSETEPTTPETTRTPPASKAVLTASPTVVGASEQIDLSGSFPELGAGATVKVQRRQDGSWLDFPDSTDPVTATTAEDGSFRTYVLTGQTGVNIWRMVAVDTGEATTPARVTVG